MDEIDAIIVRGLLADARASFKTLAEQASLSPNAVAERIRKMQREGTIRGFHVDVSPEALGQRLFALIDLKIASGVPAAAFEKRAAALPNVLSLALTTGRSDCTLKVAVGTQDELVQVIETLREFGAAETYSRIILRDQVYLPQL